VADLSLLLLSFLWGTSFLVVHDTLATTSVGVFLCLRFLIATVTTGGVAWVRRERPTPGVFRHGAQLGLALFTGFLFQTEGLRFTTPARSGFLTGLSVLFVPLLERFLRGRPIAARAWIGVGLAGVGLAVLADPFGDSLSPTTRLGDALTCGCAIAFSFQILWTSELAAGHPLGLLTTVQVAVTGLLSLALLPNENLALAGTPGFALALAYTGVVTTTLAYLVQNWAQQRTSATRAAVLFTMEPLFAALVSHGGGHEPLGAGLLAGGGLIIFGVVVVELGR
jgi:drug/metabolite transporter (DMT)-like permease